MCYVFGVHNFRNIKNLVAVKSKILMNKSSFHHAIMQMSIFFLTYCLAAGSNTKALRKHILIQTGSFNTNASKHSCLKISVSVSKGRLCYYINFSEIRELLPPQRNHIWQMRRCQLYLHCEEWRCQVIDVGYYVFPFKCQTS